MKTSSRVRNLAVAATLATAGASALATNIQVKMTVDNSYAIFYGTGTAATTFVGSDASWPTVETYNFNLPLSNFLYVVTASDLSVAQGFLGQFDNLDDLYTFYSSDPQWEVMATGLGSAAPYTGSPADLTLLTNEILDANAGGNASLGWVGLTAGPANGGGVWGGPLPGIDPGARWVWYSSNGDPDPTTPGFNHDEWLVFRIAVASEPVHEVPEPANVALGVATASVLLGSWAHRRRRLATSTIAKES